ncbi:Ketoacyl-synthetase C-terminal extension [Actinokineospora alba]|uniref:Ketoacyl-synthetase C-terminal extension n=1 Tax=Actinokineospora alba TaxID=504798 RepID=A0A1H0FC33_9PSEU|nr:polyketide synthase [Actinokineospora alba]TDP69416.1 ketoacyl-synthetase-like protein [Actinokineospora alba]SDI17234.1 Ketoacyl-synthetase C-terminal extension [Actinokineospora alba]SDN92019.1 Ketoacyl-synthetase C-terminal extension [Actinokineospora alba]
MAESVESGRIAIVGMAVRVPGAERDLDLFWRNVEQGVDSISFFERDELIGWGVPAETVDQPNFVPARGIIRDADCFDGRLFSYSPQDCALMDPQQRVLLECAWGALEHAGYSPIAQDGNRTAVYAGTGMNVYLLDNLWPNERALKAAGGLQLVISSDKDFAATRIGYKLNLQGPGIVLQSACSTSLVAVHLAAQSLLTYEADVALAGGATVAPPTRRGHLHEPGGIFSPDGRCRTFDSRAGGTVPADGAGMVVLKRLEDALRDNDTIHAVIAGSAVNNDGARKAGFTAPGPSGQAAVIAAALDVAEVDPDTIGVIETHGTGTALGDPIEVAALRQVFDTDRADRAPCALTALKSVVGHLDTAAGVVGVIKMALALTHRTVPPVAHFESPNPALKLEDSVFSVPAAARPWEPIDGVRRGGVSAFGIGGTNAHVVMEEAPPPRPVRRRRCAELILVSAKTEAAAKESLARVREFVAGSEDHQLADVAYTLRTGRAVLPYRAAFVTGTDADRTPVRAGSARGLVFALTADGELTGNRPNYDADPVYRAVIDQGVGELRAAGATVDPRSERFLAAAGLAAALRGRGVRPDAVIGHGVGAIAAACAAEVLTVSEGLGLVAATLPDNWIRPRTPQLPVYSPVTGAELTDDEALDPDFWRALLAEPTGDMVSRTVARLAPAAWVEIGTAVTAHLPGGPAATPTDRNARFLTAVGALWELGFGGDWDPAHDAGRGRVPVPTYPFAATRHYFDAPGATTTERQS